MFKADVVLQDKQIMTLITKISKGIEYLYFQAGRKSVYIGPKQGPAKQDNVIRALDYSRERADHYLDSLDELLSLLPDKAREQYASRHAAWMNGRIKKYSGSKRRR